MPRHPMTERRIVYECPGMHEGRVRTGIQYADGEGLTLNVYEPVLNGERVTIAPAVLLAVGFSDIGAVRVLGCRMSDMGAFVSWAQLLAASGIAAITYSTGANPASDSARLLAYLLENATTLGIDAAHLGLLAFSGNGPTALSLLMTGTPFRCATLLCPFTLDEDGRADVARAAAQWGFANAVAGRSVSDIAAVPLLIARAGRDEVDGLNPALDAFVVGALARNLPLTLINHPSGPHAFDVMDDSEMSRHIIGEAVAHLRFHLGSPAASHVTYK